MWYVTTLLGLIMFELCGETSSNGITNSSLAVKLMLLHLMLRALSPAFLLITGDCCIHNHKQ